VFGTPRRTPSLTTEYFTNYVSKLIEEDEEFFNPFHEEPVVTMNPLWEEDFEFENELYDPLITDLNPLFQNRIFYESMEKQFIMGIIDAVVLGEHQHDKKAYKNTFVGSQVVQYLSLFYDLCEEDCLFIAEELMNKFAIKHVKVTPKIFDMEGIYYWVGRNISPNIINHYNTDPSFVYEPKVHEDTILREIYANWKEICVQFVKVSSKRHNKISYKLISVSQPYLALKRELSKLQKFDPMVLTANERKAFFINLYNIMVVDSLIICGRPNSIIARTMFFKNKYYIVGNYKLSLDDIELCLLRENRPIPNQLFIRCRTKT
jgi:hypothetical protein